MSILFKVETEIKQHVENNLALYERKAREQALARKDPPVGEEEIASATRGELSTIKYDMVRDEARRQWTEMYKEAIGQSSCSYMEDLEQAMLNALQISHRYDQSEFMFRLIKLFENVAKSDSGCFDDRNRWTQDLAQRFSFAAMHPEEMPVLMRMDEKQLRDMRIAAREIK